MKCFNLTTANPDLDIAHSAFWHYLADLYILRTLAACWRVVSLLLFLLRPLPGLPSTRQTTFMLQKRVWNVTVLSRSRGEQTGAWQSQGRVGGAAVSLVTHPGHAGHWQVSWSHWTLSNMVIWLGFSLLFKKHQNQKHHRPHTHNSVWGVQWSVVRVSSASVCTSRLIILEMVEVPRTPNINFRWGWRASWVMYCLWLGPGLGPPNGDLEPEMLKLTSPHICTLIATYLESLAAHNSNPENRRPDTNFGCVRFGFTVKL